MVMGKVVEGVKRLIEPVLREAHIELVDVGYRREGNNWILRIFIDKVGGVRIDDCQAISQRASLLLDDADIIRQPYLLEVSSPGLTRPLKEERDFIRSVGKLIKVRTHKAFANQKTFIGRLRSYQNGIVKIETKEGNILEIPKDSVARANLEIDHTDIRK